MSGHVLIVDDDYDVRTVLSLLVENLGVSVRTATDGLTAIREVETLPPTMITLDLAMPYAGGMSVLEYLHGHPKAHAIPVLIVTANVIRDTRIAERFDNVMGILEKGVFGIADLRAYLAPHFGLGEDSESE
jgi:CheY-like chemotaxis protein